MAKTLDQSTSYIGNKSSNFHFHPIGSRQLPATHIWFVNVATEIRHHNFGDNVKRNGIFNGYLTREGPRGGKEWNPTHFMTVPTLFFKYNIYIHMNDLLSVLIGNWVGDSNPTPRPPPPLLPFTKNLGVLRGLIGCFQIYFCIHKYQSWTLTV